VDGIPLARQILSNYWGGWIGGWYEDEAGRGVLGWAQVDGGCELGALARWLLLRLVRSDLLDVVYHGEEILENEKMSKD
jgi:hypothetical protein